MPANPVSATIPRDASSPAPADAVSPTAADAACCRENALERNRTVIEAAILAPSPDNNQPWRFAADADRIRVFLDPARALPSDVNAMFDLVGLGATIENACIAARQRGFEPSVEYSRSPLASIQTGKEPAARIAFGPGGQPDPLFPHLATRCTCRKLYSTRPVAEDSLRRIAEAARRLGVDCPRFRPCETGPAPFGGAGDVQLDWLVERKQIRDFSRIIAMSDRFRFEYEPFHNEIFRQLRFSAEEAKRTRDGLDVRTLDLPPGAAFILRRLRPWSRMRWIQRLGLVGLLTLPSILSVRKSGAIGVLSVREPTPPRWLEGGRAFQRVWLAAQAEQLSLQPLGSLPVFIAQWEQYQGRNLTPKHRRWAIQLRRRCTDLLPSTAPRVVLIAFRLGYSAGPSERSLRRPASEVCIPSAAPAG